MHQEFAINYIEIIKNIIIANLRNENQNKYCFLLGNSQKKENEYIKI